MPRSRLRAFPFGIIGIPALVKQSEIGIVAVVARSAKPSDGRSGRLSRPACICGIVHGSGNIHDYDYVDFIGVNFRVRVAGDGQLDGVRAVAVVIDSLLVCRYVPCRCPCRLSCWLPWSVARSLALAVRR